MGERKNDKTKKWREIVNDKGRERGGRSAFITSF